jgi:hypothetical protein
LTGIETDISAKSDVRDSIRPRLGQDPGRGDVQQIRGSLRVEQRAGHGCASASTHGRHRQIKLPSTQSRTPAAFLAAIAAGQVGELDGGEQASAAPFRVIGRRGR